MVLRWDRRQREWEDISTPIPDRFTRVLEVLENPNRLYSGTTLFEALISDYLITGNGFWWVRDNGIGAVGEVWYVPSTAVRPVVNDARTDLSHWEIRTAAGPVEVPNDRIIHFRYGVDPLNPLLGQSRLQSLLREIDTDEGASVLTNTLLRNMGIPGVVISPKAGLKFTSDYAQALAKKYKETVSGDNAGEPLVLQGESEVTTFGWSPEQLRLREIRGVPEERITSVLGVNAAVLALGSGLAAQKVGATLIEYRSAVIEDTMAPLYRSMARTITQQLFPLFGLDRTYRLDFDLSNVRALQDYRSKRSVRLRGELEAGAIRLSEFRRAMGYKVEPEHEIYVKNDWVKPEDLLSDDEPPPMLIPSASGPGPEPQEGGAEVGDPNAE